jgi:hypothetical protein
MKSRTIPRGILGNSLNSVFPRAEVFQEPPLPCRYEQAAVTAVRKEADGHLSCLSARIVPHQEDGEARCSS